MDHAINALRPYYDVEMDMFIEEWKSGEYKKFSDCPSYHSLKALVDAMNCMKKYMGWETIKIKDEVRWRLS